MKITVYTLEDFRPDYEHGVIGVYESFEKAKIALIDILKETIISCEDELDECEEDEEYEYVEWTKRLRDSIAELKKMIKNVEKAKPSPYYACNQLYITKYSLDKEED